MSNRFGDDIRAVAGSCVHTYDPPKVGIRSTRTWVALQLIQRFWFGMCETIPFSPLYSRACPIGSSKAFGNTAAELRHKFCSGAVNAYFKRRFSPHVSSSRDERRNHQTRGVTRWGSDVSPRIRAEACWRLRRRTESISSQPAAVN